MEENINISLEELKQLSWGAKLQDNGYYELSYSAAGKNGKLYIRSTADLDNLSFYCYNPGSQQYGGYGGRDKLWSTMSGDNPLDFDVVYVAEYSTTTYSPQRLIEDLNTRFGGTVTNVTYEGWSAGVGGAFLNVCEFVEELGEKYPGVVINMVGVDALISGGSNAAVGAGITPQSDIDKLNGKYAKYIELLKKYDVHFYTIGEELSAKGGDGHALATILAQYGLDVTEIAIENTGNPGSGVGHPELYRLSIDKRILPVLAGLSTLSDEELEALLKEADNPEAWKWHVYKNGDRENGEIDFRDFFGPEVFITLNQFVNVQSLTINSNLVDALKAAGEDTLLNNLELVAHRINNIRGVVNAYTEIPDGGFNSTAPKKIAEYINKYAMMYSIYANKISDETAGIISNAEGIAAMDEDMEDLVARQLSDDYHGTNLVSEAGNNTASTEETTSVPSVSVDVPKEIEDLYDNLEGENDGAKLHDYLDKKGFNEKGRLALAGYSSGCLYSDIFKEYCAEHGYSNDIYGQLQFLEDKFNEGAFNNSGTMQNSRADIVGVQFANKILGIKDSATQVEMAKIANQGYIDGKANLN